ncbi:MAG: biotin--[acetyl-CoA-carboxylase] ligase [Deltaproteobacteria bacterium]|nr:biotin--[acetyl-CoA-carboxylase] ligase [Deltaproteobacteria bacterium]
MTLPDIAIVKEFIELEVVDSTNRYALDTGKVGLLVVAKAQTSGRGRRGRAWYSPRGKNLYMTLTVSCPDSRYPIIIGVALHEVITSLTGRKDVIIKWPNDILIGGKKVCGILCEAKGGITALGIGVNINQDHWPEDISEKAISLKEASMHPFNIPHILNKIVVSLDKWLSIYWKDGFSPIREAFLRHSHIIGVMARTEDGRRCKVIGLSMEGYLLIKVSGHTQQLICDDIHIDVKNSRE